MTNWVVMAALTMLTPLKNNTTGLFSIVPVAKVVPSGIGDVVSPRVVTYSVTCQE